jgi:hypothetical protein
MRTLRVRLVGGVALVAGRGVVEGALLARITPVTVISGTPPGRGAGRRIQLL